MSRSSSPFATSSDRRTPAIVFKGSDGKIGTFAGMPGEAQIEALIHPAKAAAFMISALLP